MMDLRYPIGEFEMPRRRLLPDARLIAIQEIAQAPAGLRSAVHGLSDDQLDTPYRPNGWTVRQVVHHLPDSHMNSYLRLKHALSEDVPTVRTYDEAAWAKLPDAAGPIEGSLALLERLHARWVYLWERLAEPDWGRRLRHPEVGEMGVDELLALYAWHGRHHIAHITRLRAREGW
ncbi:MAG: bacillithiol transferase BstA [Gemmatimonadota bacterium]|nr:bacillithiol transferase BstA [Gemmatimonadota bacterium]